MPVVTEDWKDTIIATVRDLEDFTRLHVSIGEYHGAIAAGNLRVGLKWKSATGNPAIRLYKASEQDGGRKYLANLTEAEGQLAAEIGPGC